MNRHLSAWIKHVAPPVVVLTGAVAALEAYVRVAQVPKYMMVPPSAIGQAMIDHAGELLAAMGWTTLAAVSGFAASVIIGILLAIFLSASPIIRRAFYPYTIFFQTVPIIAFAPMLLFWLGSGLISVAACAFIVSVFPVIANTLAGLLSTDPALIDLFRLYGSKPIASLIKLRLPSALPAIFTGLRVAAGLAVIGTVVAEFLVGKIVGNVGLGVVIVSRIHNSKLEVAFAAVLLASLLGLAMFALVNLASSLALRRWHASEK